MKRLLLVLSAVAVWNASCSAPKDTTTQGTKQMMQESGTTATPTEITRISLTQTLNGWGGGEAFDLTLRSDGTATWNKHKMTFKGPVVAETFSGKIPVTRFNKLTTVLRDANFFELKHHYASGKTDQETTTLNATSNGKTWSVASYSDGAPPAFFTIVQAVCAERVAIRWKKADEA